MMRGIAEAGGAVIVAIAVHLGAFAWTSGAPSANAAGDGGTEQISLQAADAILAAQVAAWNRPPPITPPMPQPAAPTPSTPSVLALPAVPDRIADTSPSVALPVASPAPAPAPDIGSAAAVVLPPPARDRPTEPEMAPEMDAAPEIRPMRRPPPQTTADRPAPVPQAAQPRQKAAGSGAAAQAGTAGTATAGTLSQARQKEVLASWGAAIRGRIERRKSYPAGAGGASGTVMVRLTVTPAGALGAVGIGASSGVAALDQAALRAVQAAAPFPPAPTGVASGPHSFTLRMQFSR